MITPGTPIIVEEGRMVYGRRSRRWRRIGIYHRGGSEGSDSIKVWFPTEGVKSRNLQYCHDLAGKAIDPTNMVLMDWHKEVPKTLGLEVNSEGELLPSALHDWSAVARLAHYLYVPRSGWNTLNVQDESLKPLKCRIVSNMQGILAEDGLVLSRHWSGTMTFTIVKDLMDLKIVDYDPETYGLKAQARTIQQVEELVKKYHESKGGA